MKFEMVIFGHMIEQMEKTAVILKSFLCLKLENHLPANLNLNRGGK